ncbi:MAG: aminotransferase class IV [Cyanobacteriota bacterium]|nr:aminotransferase class IV [Cyanobacteriota bacterium]
MTAKPAAIAWIADPTDAGQGRWGEPAALSVPLDDRGLLLAEGLFETVLVLAGRAQLLPEHLARWRQGAELLALPPPPAAGPIEALLAEAIRRSGLTDGALRLNWSRGSTAGRGLDPPDPEHCRPRFWLQLSPAEPLFLPLSAWISRWECRNPASRLSRCKSFAYGPQVLARREAREAGADDALMLAASGELSCGTAANLLLRQGGRWLTPPLSSGCLPGVMRGRALALGWAFEAALRPQDLAVAEAALLLNSLSCRPLHRCGPLELPPLPPADAEQLWRRLLSGESAPALSCSPAPRCDR